MLLQRTAAFLLSCMLCFGASAVQAAAPKEAPDEQKFEQALKKVEEAAKRGDPRAQNVLGFLYEKGKGVPQSDEEARKWYSKAAERGDKNAIRNLERISKPKWLQIYDEIREKCSLKMLVNVVLFIFVLILLAVRLSAKFMRQVKAQRKARRTQWDTQGRNAGIQQDRRE